MILAYYLSIYIHILFIHVLTFEKYYLITSIYIDIVRNFVTTVAGFTSFWTKEACTLLLKIHIDKTVIESNNWLYHSSLSVKLITI